MKRGELLGGTGLYKSIAPFLSILLLASVIASSSARIKWVALCDQYSSDSEWPLDLAANTGPTIDFAIPPRISRVILPTIHFFAGVDIVSGNLYRGPPALFP